MKNAEKVKAEINIGQGTLTKKLFIPSRLELLWKNEEK